MKYNLFISSLFVLFFSVLIGQDSPFGQVEIIDSKMNSFFVSNPNIEVLASGFEWSEGPVWVPQLNGLLFSDVPQNKVFFWSPEKGLSLFLEPSGYTSGVSRIGEKGSNGLTLDENGSLILCQHGDRRVAKLTSWSFQQPHYETLVDQFEGKRFNSPNDLVFSKNGTLFFTDPPYGLSQQDQDPDKELPYNGVYKLTPDGSLTLITNKLERPNGIGLSLDEKTLYVANSYAVNPIILAVNLTSVPYQSRVFFDGSELLKDRDGLFDGLKVHSSGMVFATGPGGILIIDPEGKHLGTILLQNATANCGFDQKEDYLYMTSDAVLARIKLK